MKPLSKINICFSCVLTFLFFLFFSNSSAFARQLTLMDGKTIEIADETKKVACFYGPSLEKVILLGAGSKIVLYSGFQKKMWAWSNVIYENIDHIPSTDAVLSPNVEELLKIKPDIIFFWNKPEAVKMLNNIGMAVVYPSGSVGKSLEDAKNLLHLYARALGKEEEKIATLYAAYFDSRLKRIADIVSTIPESDKPRVYFAIRKPLCSGGKQTSLPEIVQAAGGRCVTADIHLNYGGSVSAEQILAWNPQVIIMDHCGFKKLGSGPAEEMVAGFLNDPTFSTVSAVKSRNIHISPTGVFFWDAGQQIILQVMWLAKILHPDKFDHLIIEDELRYFYATFFNYSLTDIEVYRIINHLPPLPEKTEKQGL